MKLVFSLATLVLATLVLEDKARQVAGEAHDAYGVAAAQAREASKSLSTQVEQRPLVAMLIAGAAGYVLARLSPK